MSNAIKAAIAVVGLVASAITIYVFVEQKSEPEEPTSIQQTGVGNSVGDGNTITIDN